MNRPDHLVEGIAALWHQHFEAMATGLHDIEACDEVGGSLLTAVVLFAIECDMARNDTRVSNLVVSASRGLGRKIRQGKLLYRHVEDQTER